ncbi:predicted pyrophosphatase [Enterococcus mundtii]|uniref:Predicted pyrophosphatase n=1 Tax=Enterococcus mundtii TaxID=53346 RepID=A0AAI8R9Y7_ENTMU|nr:MazG-like family protein [Enterococcus mundtii]BBM14969.1 predicted pyrophosphatase [Enterococcus mundtii]
MNELTMNIEKWAKNKGLDQAQPEKQMLKVIEELGEVGAGMARGNLEAIKDGIGDTLVTLIILAMQHGLTADECLEQTWNEIKGRTGQMIDGVFVKSSDLEDSK